MNHNERSNTIRVCQLIGNYWPAIGGAERATETLVRELRAQSDDVIVLTRRLSADDARFENVNGVPVHRLGLPGQSKLHALTFGLHALLLVATRFRQHRILHVQDIDTSTIVGMAARLLPGRRLVTTIHGEFPLIGRSGSRTGRMRIQGMVRATDIFTSINPENTRRLIGAGVERKSIREIPNGIDGSVFRPATKDERAAARAALGLDMDEVVALYLGRLHPYKRVDLLVDAWSRLPRDHRGRLVIVGGGSAEGPLREQAAGVTSIRIDGPTDEPLRYLQAADIYVNSSGDKPSGDSKIAFMEGLSVALLEAAFVGVLPIVTSVPGNNVIVEDGVTGLCFPVEDCDALTACLNRAIESPELRSRLAHQLHDSVVEKYSASVVARQVAAVYRELGDQT